ncbi:MAG: UDP-N-acetylmuramoyl-tripeptide--D-alanyl-D-alanine ligase [Sphingobacteriaceae bacterium]|nr:UDP-N-acetylmuramoyl-tripeptide--D-alanyl-D-alanine ligase [Sphingobacteriaceae bacterium]
MIEKLSIDALYKKFVDAGYNVTTDTRKVIPGSIFFSLKGPNFNANELAAKAIEAGCKYAIVDEEKFANNTTIFLVGDGLMALQELAHHHRQQFKIPFLAITGSNAKTTHKEFINAVLSKKYKTLATEGNLNNHIGVPLTLLKLRPDHEFAIIEMGANHQGEINELCEIADPDFGMITNIGKAHLEGFGGIEGVKKGKSELYRYLQKKHAKVFANGDDEVLHELAKDNDKISYGTTKLYDTIGKYIPDGEMVSFKWTTRYGDKDWNKLPLVKSQITGKYNFINCLAAVCVGHHFHVEDAMINEALSEYVPAMNRSQMVKTESNSILLDAYNANPNSMKAAIENFADYKAEQKWLLLGDMFELGDYSKAEHQAIVNLLNDKKLSNVILVGNEFASLESNSFKTFKTTQECLEHLRAHQIKNATVLIKGSRGMKMETLQEAL